MGEHDASADAARGVERKQRTFNSSHGMVTPESGVKGLGWYKDLLNGERADGTVIVEGTIAVIVDGSVGWPVTPPGEFCSCYGANADQVAHQRSGERLGVPEDEICDGEER